jgi:hypothetical protein
MTRDDFVLRREESLKLLEGFRLIDDDFMTVFFKDNIPCTELVLRIVLDMPDLVVEEVHTQVHLSNMPEDRAVRLDVVARDGEGRLINIEVQRTDKGAGSRRARFNSSMLDASLLQKGQGFDRLPETYVIFITERDFFGKGLPVYKIERCILDLNALFDDGAHILYVNGSYRDDTPVGRLMHDFFCARSEDMHYGILAKKMEYYKKTNEGSGNMCKAMEDLMRRRDLKTARELMAMGKFTLEEATNFFNLSLEEVRQLKKEMAP